MRTLHPFYLVLPALILSVPPVLAQTPLTLEDATRRAQLDTADARELAATVAGAVAGIQRAQSGFWPRVDFSESVQRGNQPVFVFGSLLSQRRFTAANFALPALTHPDAITNTRTALTVEQSLFDAGRTRLGVQAAKVQLARSESGRDAAKQDLAWRAAQAFVRVLQLEAAGRAADAAVAAAESDRERVRARRDVGLVTDADALTLDVHVADMRQRQIAAAGDLAVARLQLADAVGLPLTTVVEPVRPSPRLESADDEAAVREALKTHPALRQVDALVALADNGRRSARAALWPTLGVQAAWEFNGAGLGTQQSSWVVGAELHVNAFRGFADTAQVADARQALVRATAERVRIGREIEVAVRAAAVQLAAARARQIAGQAALRQARESQRIIRDRYEIGVATVTDVLRAAEAALDAESRATAADMDVLLQSVALDRAIGRL